MSVQSGIFKYGDIEDTPSIKTADHKIYTLFLFGTNNNGEAQPFTSYNMQVYGCKIYDNEQLIRNYIPCYRKSDDIAGLYDLVNGVFYTNAGAGEFSIGEMEGVLPREYKRVEYIESTGSQYVVTDIIPNGGTKILLDMEYIGSNSTKQYNALLGAREKDNTSVNKFGVWVQKNTASIGINYGIHDTDGIYGTSCLGRHIYKNEFDGSDSLWYLDDTCVAILSKQDFTTTVKPLSIFASNDGSTTNIDTRELLARFYLLKIYDESTLISELIPCYVKSTNITGMYDLVNGKFFANGGTGEFIIGE